MDRGTWWATVGEVTKSWTRLSDLTLSLFPINLPLKLFSVFRLENLTPFYFSSYVLLSKSFNFFVCFKISIHFSYTSNKLWGEICHITNKDPFDHYHIFLSRDNHC